MNQQIRNDGEYAIYRVDVKAGERYITWHHLIPTIPNSVMYASDRDRRNGKRKDPMGSYNANGECWEKTGINGLFDRSQATELLEILAKHNPTRTFRVTEMKITQKITVIMEVEGEDV